MKFHVTYPKGTNSAQLMVLSWNEITQTYEYGKDLDEIIKDLDSVVGKLKRFKKLARKEKRITLDK